MHKKRGQCEHKAGNIHQGYNINRRKTACQTTERRLTNRPDHQDTLSEKQCVQQVPSDMEVLS